MRIKYTKCFLAKGKIGNLSLYVSKRIGIYVNVFFCDIYWYVYSVVYLAPIPHWHSDVAIRCKYWRPQRSDLVMPVQVMLFYNKATKIISNCLHGLECTQIRTGNTLCRRLRILQILLKYSI